jgi:hypothetical protein
MNGPRRLLLVGLLVILAMVNARALVGLLVAPRFAVDIEIPMRAAARWVAGQPPYLASAFNEPPGPTLPFLYPPYTLPLLGALDLLPRALVEIAGVAAMLGFGILACRRLSIPWLWVPLILLWPPFAEGIISGNVQIALFAGFVYLFYVPGGSPWVAPPRNISDPATSDLMVGGLATLSGAVKVSQPHSWIYALRRRPRAAIGGAIVAALVAAATLPLTGITIWSDWLTQLRLADDPSWQIGGIALSHYFPNGPGLAVAIVCLAAVPFVPWRTAGAWIGVLSVVGSLSLHTFGLLFLLPAMLIIRREIALWVAILISTYTLQGTWAAILICTWAFVASTRWPALREPTLHTETEPPAATNLVPSTP